MLMFRSKSNGKQTWVIVSDISEASRIAVFTKQHTTYYPKSYGTWERIF